MRHILSARLFKDNDGNQAEWETVCTCGKYFVFYKNALKHLDEVRINDELDRVWEANHG